MNGCFSLCEAAAVLPRRSRFPRCERTQQEFGSSAMGSEPSCGDAERNPVSGALECRLPMSRHGWLAPAAKVRIPPFVLKSAWCSNLTASPSHNYRERPIAAVRCSALRCGAASPKWTLAKVCNNLARPMTVMRIFKTFAAVAPMTAL
jgi:hypothetical protein